jgi:cell division septal protein FtsQ
MSLPVRRPAARSRARRPARASAAGAAAARGLGLAGILVSLVALTLLVPGDAFAVGSTGLRVEGARYTSVAQVRDLVGLNGGARLNLVTLHVAPLVKSLHGLAAIDPARADAVSVRVVLPGTLVVTLRERQPILVWQVGGRELLVDTTGTLFADQGPDQVIASLPAVIDERASSAGLQVGGQLDPVAFAAVRRLAAVTPAMLGSTAASLTVALDDTDGFTISAPVGWRAVFGLYTANLRPPSLVDRQVQCLSSLLAKVGEAAVQTIYLSPVGDVCGTYTTRTAKP